MSLLSDVAAGILECERVCVSRFRRGTTFDRDSLHYRPLALSAASAYSHITCVVPLDEYVQKGAPLDRVMDTCNKASASGATACATDEALTVTLPPKDATCDLTSEKMTKKAKRKASRSRQEDDTRHCVTDCLVNGEGNMVQCHLCQTWCHLECVGETDSAVANLWKCKRCRALPTLVERILEKTSALEDVVRRLETSNQQLVTLVVEQRQEISGLRAEVKQGFRRPYAEVARPDGRATLLVGNSLLSDVAFRKNGDGSSTEVRKKSGATFNDIGELIDGVVNKELKDIIIVGGSREAMEKVPTEKTRIQT